RVFAIGRPKNRHAPQGEGADRRELGENRRDRACSGQFPLGLHSFRPASEKVRIMRDGAPNELSFSSGRDDQARKLRETRVAQF
ncbi:MAG TPA: hypothetical protein PLI13_11190, partial [Paracoccus sp. (in: a-proteobacteria)]|nr:hypothetical protein [Paracoccus sp. (in: a-proteobacteria)]